MLTEPRPKDLNQGGFTPLLYAAREGCVECAKHLVAGGADLNLDDPPACQCVEAFRWVWRVDHCSPPLGLFPSLSMSVLKRITA